MHNIEARIFSFSKNEFWSLLYSFVDNNVFASDGISDEV